MEKSKKFIQLCKKYQVDPDNIPEILSFEDACKVTGDDPARLPAVIGIPLKHQKRLMADYKLSIIADALRNNKPPDYNNLDEDKYFALFSVEANKKKPSGFGLSFSDYVYWYTASGVGVRLCFPTRELTIFFGKHFIDLHKDHHLYT